MTKFLILDVTKEVNTKTEEEFFIMQAFGSVQKFGKISKQAISIRLDGKESYVKYCALIGKHIELNIVLPHSDYSYSLFSEI